MRIKTALMFCSVQRFANEKPYGNRRGGGVSDLFGNSKSILGQPPIFGGASNSSGLLGGGMTPGAYGAVLLSAKRSLLSSSSHRYHRGSSYRSNRSRLHDSKEIDFTADVDVGGDSSPNGKDKRKSKREKFQPY